MSESASMICPICNEQMSYFFEKAFNKYGLNKVNYFRCQNCGFVQSKTHKDMTHGEWGNLNKLYHESFFGFKCNPDDLNWFSRLTLQKDIINELASADLLPKDLPWLDYGCGDGKLADMLNSLSLPTMKYDRYMSSEEYLTDTQLISTKYSLVINTSVFEHIVSIEDLEEIINLVNSRGVFALHTLVREEIPADPNWFYLLPVHCSFFSNRSMEILFDKWGFYFSLYDPESRMWFWFKENRMGEMERFASKYAKNVLIKKGFADYWK